jgi:Carbohydrate esterase 2 N-terminal/GDSL-like Lipase/Acylhydrolase family
MSDPLISVPARILWPCASRLALVAGALAVCSIAGCSSGSSSANGSAGAESNSSAGVSSTNGGSSAAATAGSSGSPASSSGAGGSTSNGGSSNGGTSNGGSANGGSSPGSAGAPSVGFGGAGAAGGAAQGGGGVSGVGGSGGAPGTPGVRIVGRTVATATGTSFEWSGSSVSARFTGTQVSVQLDDGKNGNAFAVVIDGGAPNKIFTVAGQTTYQVATGLANGAHDLLFWRDTEASYGASVFIGLTDFGTGGALLPPAPAPQHSIEIVGDSFSCGAGMEAAPPACPSGIKIENHYLSYGAIAARSVGADLVTIAWSGIGVWRNFGATKPTPTTVMPARYDYAIPTDTSTTWDFSKHQPDAVVMNLNNNDFSVGDPGQPYIDAYLAFYKHIRSKYPNAYVFHIIQWNSADPTVTDAVTTINGIVATIQAGGDTKTEAFDLRKYSNTKQCGGHPDMAASQAMGDALAAELHRVLSW